MREFPELGSHTSLWECRSAAITPKEETTKTLTAFTAVAALVAGMSIASAAGSMNKAMRERHRDAITGTSQFCIKDHRGR